MAHQRTCSSPAGHVAAEGGRPGASQSRIENCLPTSSCVANLRFAWSLKGLLSPPATSKVESLSTKAGRRGTRQVACCCCILDKCTSSTDKCLSSCKAKSTVKHPSECFDLSKCHIMSSCKPLP